PGEAVAVASVSAASCRVVMVPRGSCREGGAKAMARPRRSLAVTQCVIYTTMLPICDNCVERSVATATTHNVAAAFTAVTGVGRSAPGADHLDVEVADLLAQCVAVDAEEIGGANLVAARCRQCGGQQRVFDLA